MKDQPFFEKRPNSFLMTTTTEVSLRDEEFERVAKVLFTEALTIATGFDHNSSKKIAAKLIAELENKGVRIVVEDFDKSISDLTGRYKYLLCRMMEVKTTFTSYNEHEIKKLSPGERSKYLHAAKMAQLGISAVVKEYLKLSWNEISSIVSAPTIHETDPEPYRLLKMGIQDVKKAESFGEYPTLAR